MVDKTLKDACYLITNMAENSKNFGIRGNFHAKRIDEVSSSNLDAKIEALTLNKKELTSLMKSLVCGGNMAKRCSICFMNDHTTDFCP